MRTTSALYKRLLSDEHIIETRLVVGTEGVLIDEEGNVIEFGLDNTETQAHVMVEQGGPEDGYTEAEIMSLETYHELFNGEQPTIGGTISGQINVSFLAGNRQFDRMSQIVPYIRLVSADGTEKSEWLKKGVYYIDTREHAHNDNGLDITTFTGFDAMLKAQADYPDSDIDYPALDVDIVRECCKEEKYGGLGITIDDRTWSIMQGGYRYGLPLGYSIGEVLSFIAMPYAGNWIITEEGELRLISFYDIPKETRVIIDEVGYELDFGMYEGELKPGETDADRAFCYIMI